MWTTNVKNVLLFPIHCLVQRIGCFKDTARRAIPQLDGKSILLRGSYRHRKFAIKKCALESARRGYKFMAIQHGGWCASGPHAHRTFARYGRSNRCRNGKGGPWANDVYRISGGVFRKYLLKSDAQLQTWLVSTLCGISAREFFSATTRTGPLWKELTNQNVTWEQMIAIFFSNKPITLKIMNNRS